MKTACSASPRSPVLENCVDEGCGLGLAVFAGGRSWSLLSLRLWAGRFMVGGGEKAGCGEKSAGCGTAADGGKFGPVVFHLGLDGGVLPVEGQSSVS